MAPDNQRLQSACVFCGSSESADPAFLQAAADLGRALAQAGIKLVYGGGGVGLMGATARAAHAAGGEVEHIVVDNMHQRKMLMFERADSFVILPGGVGTLEEVVELLSWRRLDLHAKPVVFYNPRDFWAPLFALFQHTVDEKLTPPEFMQAWVSVERVEDIVPALLRWGSGDDPAAEARVARLS
jgi:predicted Rossmann-fold nucleotide-binding protein